MNQDYFNVVLADLQHSNRIVMKLAEQPEKVYELILEIQKYTERKADKPDYMQRMTEELEEFHNMRSIGTDPAFLICALHEVADINYFRFLVFQSYEHEVAVNTIQNMLDPLEGIVIGMLRTLAGIESDNPFLVTFKDLSTTLLSVYDRLTNPRGYVYMLDLLSIHKLHSSIWVKDFLKGVETKKFELRR